MKKFVFVLAITAVLFAIGCGLPSKSEAGAYVALGGEYSFKDRSDIFDYSVQPVAYAGLELGSKLALVVEASHGVPIQFVNQDLKRHAELVAKVKFNF